MRVLQIGLSDNRGGVETFVMSYFRELSKCGVTFDFVDIYGGGLAYSDEIQSLGGKIYTLPNYKKHPFKTKKSMTDIIRGGNYEIVHINMLSAANLLPLKATLRAKSVPVTHSHNTGTEGLLRTVMHKLHKTVLKKPKITRLACGIEAGKWLYGDSPFEVIPNAIDTEKFAFDPLARQAIRSELNIDDDAVVLGFVGRLTEQKNPEYLIKILSSVKNSDRNYKLLIVGGGELKEQVEKAAKSVGVLDDVIFAGVQSETASWYSAMDCFVLPSLYEGFAIVAIEAQANGLPCLFSNTIAEETAITDLVKFLPLSQSAEEWGEEIEKITFSVSCRSAGYLSGTVYDIKTAADKLKSVYDRAAEGK